MKSVIAQGATVSKAVEEAIKKAENPKEFFIKILQEAQGGFLGFGSIKAKVALFFKKEEFSRHNSETLSQDSYKGLFNNKSLQQQIDKQATDSVDKKEQSAQMNVRELKPRDGFKPKMKRRTLKSDQHQTRSMRPSGPKKPKAQADQSGQERTDQKVGEPRTDQKRANHRSARRPRQGSRWGTNRDTSKNKDDKDKS